MTEKRYIVRKYVMAKSIVEAVEKEKKQPADDCWIDENQPTQTEQASLIGFVSDEGGYYYSPHMKRRKKK